MHDGHNAGGIQCATCAEHRFGAESKRSQNPEPAPLRIRGGSPMGLLIRFIVTAIAVAAAVYLVPGIDVGDNATKAVILTAIILGIVNAFIRPLLKLLSLPIIMMTLGLFILVVNAVCFYLAAWISRTIFDVEFSFDDIWAVLFGAIIISIVSTVINWFVPDDK
jgi:putative membrane protein